MKQALSKPADAPERIMTDDEIKTSYRDAKDKAEQIKILAQLNTLPMSEIRRILGVKPHKSKWARVDWTPAMMNDVERLRGEGKSWANIGQRYGISESAAYSGYIRNKIR